MSPLDWFFYGILAALALCWFYGILPSLGLWLNYGKNWFYNILAPLGLRLNYWKNWSYSILGLRHANISFSGQDSEGKTPLYIWRNEEGMHRPENQIRPFNGQAFNWQAFNWQPYREALRRALIWQARERRVRQTFDRQALYRRSLDLDRRLRDLELDLRYFKGDEPYVMWQLFHCEHFGILQSRLEPKRVSLHKDLKRVSLYDDLLDLDTILDLDRRWLDLDRRWLDLNQQVLDRDQQVLDQSSLDLNQRRNSLHERRQSLHRERSPLDQRRQKLKEDQQSLEGSKRYAQANDRFGQAPDSGREEWDRHIEYIDSELQANDSKLQAIDGQLRALEPTQRELDLDQQAFNRDQEEFDRYQQALNRYQQALQHSRQALDLYEQALQALDPQALDRQARDLKAFYRGFVEDLPALLTHDFNSENLSIGKIKFNAFDYDNYRIAHRAWRERFEKVDAAVYFVDDADTQTYSVSFCELAALLLDDSLANVPLLILANNYDEHQGGLASDWIKQLIDNCRDINCMIRPVKVFKRSMREKGLKWLFHYI
uniref:Uncharacterized protein n=1 Tax=Araucaria cunninghamii TaxID=56994 RepID=A0A0D6QUK3_ARACU